MGQPIDEASVLLVPDVSQFERLLKSAIDSAMRQVQQTVAVAMDRVEREFAGASRELATDFRRGGAIAESSLRGVGNQAQVSMAQVSASSSAAAGAMSARLGGALALVKAGLLSLGVAAGAGLAAIAGFGLKAAANIEQVQIGLEAMLGSASEARGFLEEIQEFAAKTPFEFAGVADASRRILAFGTSVGIARDEVIPTITTIGNLVSVLGGTQESVDSVVRAFGQMASKGKISQEELLQLAEALPGFNANAAIAAALGLSVGESMEAITAGEVDATTGINALLTGMAKFPGAAGAMEKQSQTLLGVFSTFKDTLSIELTKAFQPVIPQIKESLTELTPVLGESLGKIAPALGGLLARLLPLLGKLVEFVTPILVPLLDTLGVVMDQLTPALEPLGAAFTQVLTALLPLVPILGEVLAEVLVELAPAIAELAPVLAELVPPLTQLLISLIPLIHPLGQLLLAVVKLLVPIASFIGWLIQLYASNANFEPIIAAIQFFTDLLMVLASFLLNTDWGGIWNQILIWFDTAVESVNRSVAGFVSDMMGLPGRVISAIADLAGKVGEWASGVIGKFYSAGRDMVFGVWNGISSLAGWLYERVKNFIYNNTIGAAQNILGIHSPSTVARDEVGRQITAGAATGVTDGMAALRSAIGGIVPAAMGSNTTNSTNVGGITINVMFSGATPTEAEARRTGAAVGAGVASTLARRGISFGVRTVGASAGG